MTNSLVLITISASPAGAVEKVCITVADALDVRDVDFRFDIVSNLSI